MKLRLSLVLALALTACGDSSPSDTAAPGAILRVDVLGSPPDETTQPYALDGLQALITDSTQIGLVDFDANGQIVPALATSWRVSDDGLSYIFRLREAEWEDSRAITAGDVVAVYRRIFERGSNHPLKPFLIRIENAADIASGRKPVRTLGVHDPRPNIVEIRLTSPQPALLQLLAHPSMAIRRRGPTPPSNGPFTVIGHATGSIRLIRNRNFYDAGAVPLRQIDLQATSDIATAVARFQRGETDVVTGGTVAGLGAARTLPIRDALRVEPTYGVYGYVMNVREGPLSDLRVRRALAMAIDRDALVARLFAIEAMQPVFGLLPPTLPGQYTAGQPDWASWAPDARLAEARRLLAEAGYRPERPLQLTVNLPDGREHAAALAAVSSAWAQLGVQVAARTKGVIGHAEVLEKGDYQLALVERIAPADTPSFFLLPFTCAANSGGYCNPEADRLLDQARAMPDLASRAQQLQRAETLMAADAPAIMLFVPVRWSLVHPRVSGWNGNIVGAHPLARLDMLPDGGIVGGR